MKKITIYALFFSFILMFSSSFAEDISDEKRKLLNIQYELAEQKKKLNFTRVEEQRALSSLYVIQRNLKHAKKSMSDAKFKVQYNQKMIVVMRNDLADAQNQIQDKSKELKFRIREVYKSRSGGILDILFASRSMADLSRS